MTGGRDCANLACVHEWIAMAFLCRLHVRTGCSTGPGGATCMLMHAQSHAQALLAARELFPSCQVEVVAIPCRHQRRNEAGEA